MLDACLQRVDLRDIVAGAARRHGHLHECIALGHGSLAGDRWHGHQLRAVASNGRTSSTGGPSTVR
jgi:hypothetical protein